MQLMIVLTIAVATVVALPLDEPVPGLVNPSIPLETSLQQSINDPLTVEYPVKDIPVEDPSEDPLALEHPLEDHLTVEHPIEDHLTVENPIEDDLTVENPIEDPVSVKKPIEYPLPVEEPVNDLLLQEKPLVGEPYNMEVFLAFSSFADPLPEI